MSLDKCSLNGEIKPLLEASVSITNIEYAYGFGVYETIRVIGKVPYFLDEHIERLLMSAKTISLEHIFSKTGIEKYLRKLVEQLCSTEAYNLKIILIGAKEANDCLVYIFPSKPLFPEKRDQREGVAVLTVQYERIFPNAKTLNMLQSYVAFKEAKKKGCYDALAVNSTGLITEGTMTNFFLIKGKTIFTSPNSKILDGVTKQIVLKLAALNGFNIEEKCATISELADYEGAFLTSTSSKIMPIIKINDFTFAAVPEAVKLLGKIYDDFLSNCNGLLRL